MLTFATRASPGS